MTSSMVQIISIMLNVILLIRILFALFYNPIFTIKCTLSYTIYENETET